MTRTETKQRRTGLRPRFPISGLVMTLPALNRYPRYATAAACRSSSAGPQGCSVISSRRTERILLSNSKSSYTYRGAARRRRVRRPCACSRLSTWGLLLRAVASFPYLPSGPSALAFTLRSCTLHIIFLPGAACIASLRSVFQLRCSVIFFRASARITAEFRTLSSLTLTKGLRCWLPTCNLSASQYHLVECCEPKISTANMDHLQNFDAARLTSLDLPGCIHGPNREVQETVREFPPDFVLAVSAHESVHLLYRRLGCVQRFPGNSTRLRPVGADSGGPGRTGFFR